MVWIWHTLIVFIILYLIVLKIIRINVDFKEKSDIMQLKVLKINKGTLKEGGCRK